MSESDNGSKAQASRIIELVRQTSPQLFQDGSLTQLVKAVDLNVGQGSIDSSYGRQPHPLDYEAIEAIGDANVDHRSCLLAKVNSTTGLGHKNVDLYDVLDPLCNFTWQKVLDSACYDYWEKGVGLIEVVRNGPGGEITGLHHLPVKHTYVYWEGNNQWHYEVDSPATVSRTGVTFKPTKKLARFGDLEALKARAAANDLDDTVIVDSEVILIPAISNKPSLYGDIDWRPAVPTMELVQVSTQEEFDFHYNRSVPEFLMMILGAVSEDVMESLEKSLMGAVGPGNQRKSVVAALSGASRESHEIFFEHIGAQGKQESKFSEDDVAHSLKICSSHGVPALLAGIQVPGKMGANNEFPNALSSFQTLKIAGAQKLWSRMLACTLGQEEAGLGLSPQDFLTAPLTEEEKLMGKQQDMMNGFTKITEELNLDAMDTAARMREPLIGSGRNPNDGLLERGGERE